QSGALIPGAHVTVRNEINGVSQTTTTDSSGSYSFNNVPSGNSALFVESAGFQKFQLSNFYVGAGRRNEIDATLQVGSVAETVEVQAAPVSVNTESATIRSRAGKEVVAETKDLGDLFEYRVKDKITVGKNQSAL